MIILTVILTLVTITTVCYSLLRISKLKEEVRTYRGIIVRYEEERKQREREEREAEEEEDDSAEIEKGVVPAAQDVVEMDENALRERAINKGLYDLILQVMHDEKPYANENFDFDRLVQLVNSNRTYVSRAINDVYGKNFRSWLADYRNAMVVKELKKNPVVEVEWLARNIGYDSVATLKRQFRKMNGMTLAEFRSQLFDEK